jgi:hypothetical protein
LKAAFSRVQAAALQEVKERDHRETSMLLLQTSSLIDKVSAGNQDFLIASNHMKFQQLV